MDPCPVIQFLDKLPNHSPRAGRNSCSGDRVTIDLKKPIISCPMPTVATNLPANFGSYRSFRRL